MFFVQVTSNTVINQTTSIGLHPVSMKDQRAMIGPHIQYASKKTDVEKKWRKASIRKVVSWIE